MKTLKTLALAGLIGWAAPAATTLAQDGATAEAAPVADAKAQEIWDKNIKAEFGDVAKTRSVKAIRMVSTVSMPSQGMSMELDALIAEGGRMISVMEIPGLGEMQQGVLDGVAWSYSQLTGPMVMEGAQRDQNLNQADIYAQLDWTNAFSSLEYSGTETVTDADGEEVEAHVLTLVSKASGNEEKRFIHPESGLKLRTESELVMDGGTTAPSVTVYSDYRDVGKGMMMPFRVELSMGPMTQIVTTSEVEINPEIEGDEFELPEEVRAIAG